MTHEGTVRLETARLVLRRAEPGDAAAMFRNWAADPAVTRFLVWPAYTDEGAVRAYLEALCARYAQPSCYDWLLVLKRTGEPVGDIAAVRVDDSVDSVHIGYCIGRGWWGQGLTAEAFAAVIRFFFEQVGANRVESRHDPRNPNSGRVMRKCGLRYEGTLRAADRNNLGLCDAAYYGLLRAEYGAAQG